MVEFLRHSLVLEPNKRKKKSFNGYLRIEIADVHRPADLIYFGRVHVAHDRGLGGHGAQ